MRLPSRSTLLSLVSLAALCVAQTVDSYIATEGAIAKTGVLANIGPSGSKASGAKAGVVIAAPSVSIHRTVH